MTKASDHLSRGSTLSMHLEGWEAKAQGFLVMGRIVSQQLGLSYTLRCAFIGIRGFDINTLGINIIPIFLARRKTPTYNVMPCLLNKATIKLKCYKKQTPMLQKTNPESPAT